MSSICSKTEFSVVANEVMLQAAVRRSYLGICKVTVGLGRKTVVPSGQPRSW